MLNKNINGLIVKCAEVLALNGIVRADHVSYISLEKELIHFLDKYDLWKTSDGKKIKSNLLGDGPNEYFTNDEIREIIQSLVNFRSFVNIKFDKIFISHSTKDLIVVKEFVSLLESFGLTDDHIFCSSVPGYGIPLGENIYDFLNKQFNQFNLLVVFILSDNYYNSVACLNEMGATWMNKNDYQAILLNDFKVQDIKGAIDPRNICFSINDKYRLNDFKDKLITSFSIKKRDSSRWEQLRDEFIEKIIP